MSDYIKRILAKAEFTGNFRDEYPTALIHALIDSIPAADVVEVVRCKDCEYCTKMDEFEYWCNGLYYGFYYPARLVGKDDFCSHGKRNGGDEA